MYRILKLLALLACMSAPAFSQTHKIGTWGALTIQLPADTNHHFGGYLESKVQTNGIAFDQFYYYDLKAGVTYAFDKNYSAMIGTGRYLTYNYLNVASGPVDTENRIWEQLCYSHNLSRLKFEHRYRIEQRWLNSVFRTTLRYRLNAVLPFNSKKIEPGTIYMSVFDEIFLGNKQFSWEKNRMSAVLGYQFSKSFLLNAGWINEDNNSLLNSLEKNNLLVNLICRIGRKGQ